MQKFGFFLSGTLTGVLFFNACSAPSNPEEYSPETWKPLPKPSSPPAPQEDPIKKAAKEWASASTILSTNDYRLENDILKKYPVVQDTAALVLMASKNGNAGQCSGFLIDERHILTNSHCIPVELAAPASDCSGMIFVLFPGIDSDQPLRVDCKRVVSNSGFISEKATVQNDFAVLELAQAVTDRKPIEIDRSGYKEGEEVSIYKMDPPDSRSNYSTIGWLRVERCNVVFNSLLLLDSTSGLSRLTYLSNCSIRPGNSGSMIIGENGKIKGLVHISVDSQKVLDVFSTAFQKVSELLKIESSRGDEGNQAIASNMGCITLPGATAPQNTEEACGPKVFDLANTTRMIEKLETYIFTLNDEIPGKSRLFLSLMDEVNKKSQFFKFGYNTKALTLAVDCFKKDKWKHNQQMKETLDVPSLNLKPVLLTKNLTIIPGSLNLVTQSMTFQEDHYNDTERPTPIDMRVYFGPPNVTDFYKLDDKIIYQCQEP
jgi:hypothetical protein